MHFEFAAFAGGGMLPAMNRSTQNSANPLVARIQRLFGRDLALENDYLRQENKISAQQVGQPGAPD